jgi:RNA-directed DNA polymerase
MIETVHELTAEAGVWQETTALVDKLNRTLRGWANYFQVGMVTQAYRAIGSYTTMRLSRWLRNKYKVRRRWHGGYPLVPVLPRPCLLVRLHDQRWFQFPDSSRVLPSVSYQLVDLLLASPLFVGAGKGFLVYE